MLRFRWRSARRFAMELDGAWPAQPDPDEQLMLAVTQRLRQVDPGGAPDADFRARGRQRLMAVATVARAEPQATGDPVTLAAETRRPGPAPARSRRLAAVLTSRRLIGALAAACTLVIVAGMLVLFSRSALPGDPLYSLKRGTERAELSLTGDDQERGLTLLGFAATRLTEVKQLAGLPTAAAAAGAGSVTAVADGPASVTDSPTESAIVATLEEMDLQTSQGTAALTRFAVDSHDTRVLSQLSSWTTGQRAGLATLTGLLPGAADGRAEQSAGLLVRIVTRAIALGVALPCDCGVTTVRTDDLGPLPSADPTSAALITGATDVPPTSEPDIATQSASGPTPTAEPTVPTTEAPPYSPPTDPATTDVPPSSDPVPTTDPAPTTDPLPTTDPTPTTDPPPTTTDPAPTTDPPSGSEPTTPETIIDPSPPSEFPAG